MTEAAVPPSGAEEGGVSLKDQGNDFFKSGNYLKAAALYTQAIKQDPSNPTLYRFSSHPFPSIFTAAFDLFYIWGCHKWFCSIDDFRCCRNVLLMPVWYSQLLALETQMGYWAFKRNLMVGAFILLVLYRWLECPTMDGDDPEVLFQDREMFPLWWWVYG